jgi:NADPH2:quinone reductase
MAWNGRYLVVGFAGGDIPKIPLNLPLLKGCSILGVQAGFHAMHEPAASRSMVEELIGHIAAGRLKPLISATYPLERMRQGLASIRDRTACGKIVVTLS